MAVQERLREHEGEERAWAARTDALTTALDAARARAGAKRLAGLDGIVGTMLDLVEVDTGWEAAVEAALGEAISAVVVRDATVARAALERLHESSESGAVLALDALSRFNTGTADLSGVPGQAVRLHVRARNADAERLLDRLLTGAVAVDGTWSDALDVALAHPVAVVVTRSGDRFSASGWRAGAGAVGATGAALEEATVAAQLATATATATRDMLVGARTAAKAARFELDVARSDEQRMARDLERSQARIASLTQQHERLLTERSDVERELAGVVAQRAEFADRHQRELHVVAALDSRLPALVEAETELALRQAQRRDASQRLDERARAIATLRRDLEVQAAALEERARVLGDRQLEIDERLSRSIAERAAAEIRRIELDLLAERTEALHAVVQDRAELIEGGLALLRDERRRQSEAARAATSRLDGLRKERAGVEKHLVETRERLQRNELEVSEVRLRIETLVEQVRREFDVEPERVMESECPELVDGTSAPTRLRDLERELRLMGPINPLALEEFTALEERHALIEVQLDDVKSTRRELAKVISAIDEEIVTVFAAAYADVEENFAKLFGGLFPGGSGHLRLTDPDNPLDTGVEVEARPSGKNVRKLSLLSGGERSLTALAFLFAVFRSRPSPFYLLDEVEAALDDVNLTRFLGLLAEFRQEAQLLVVSHQKRTMEAADCLYGVTMQPGGSSKVVSERVALNA